LAWNNLSYRCCEKGCCNGGMDPLRDVRTLSGAPTAPKLIAQGIALGKLLQRERAEGPRFGLQARSRAFSPGTLPRKPSPLGWAIDFGAFGAGRFHAEHTCSTCCTSAEGGIRFWRLSSRGVFTPSRWCGTLPGACKKLGARAPRLLGPRFSRIGRLAFPGKARLAPHVDRADSHDSERSPQPCRETAHSFPKLHAAAAHSL
jgi:hypothetical protein